MNAEETHSSAEYLSLDDIKRESLKILVAFDRFCESHALRYSLAGGTLLGAVRHGGFIPWDDDVDVMMPRPDYEKLLNLGDQWKVATGYIIHAYPRANSVGAPFVKLINPAIHTSIAKHSEASYLGIDVLPVDGLPTDEAIDEVYVRSKEYRRTIEALDARPELASSQLKRMLKGAYRILNRCIPLQQIVVRKLDEHARSLPYEDSEYVGVVSWGLYGPGERMLKSKFEETETTLFEGRSFRIMSCWHDYLSGIYGNYMELPPEEERTAHGMKAWVDGLSYRGGKAAIEDSIL